MNKSKGASTALIWLARLLGVLVTVVLGSIETRFLRWHTSNREVTTT